MANSPSLTLHNFSFRNDPLNAPKGQEITHAFDEAVEIFPAQIDTMEKMMVAKAPAGSKSQDRKLAAASASTASESTSLSPSLPSGLLKVKMFGKMKEKNTFDTPPQGSGTGHSMGGGASPSTVEAEVTMEIDDDEDFDLETPNNGTQSLGNSGVTITPISSLNKSKRKNESPIANIHLPANFELTKKSKFSNPSKENKPFTLGSTTITSAMGPSTTKAKALPSVTLTPTGNQGAGAKKRASFGGKVATPLRPIEAQSVVNIAGMKYLVVPHPDPGKCCRKSHFFRKLTINTFFADILKSKRKEAPGKLPIVLKPQQPGVEDCPSFEVEETTDGKLTLLPFGNNTSGIKQMLKKKSSASYDFNDFQNTLSAGYFAMLHVFKYLGTKNRLTASRVCKLWYQISRHSSLWTNITLKVMNIKI